MKSLKIYDAKTLKQVYELSIPNTTINTFAYIPQNNSISICASDRFLYFYDCDTYKLQRRFQLPDIQLLLTYFCNGRKILFSGGSSGLIYGWDIDKIFGDEFLELLKKKKESYRNALADSTPL